MLAALIASQSLVTFVAAAPTPADEPELVVNLLDTFVQKHPTEVRKIACFIAKDPKDACTNPSLKQKIDAVNFLAEHGHCEAFNYKSGTVDFRVGDDFAVINECPLAAYCFFREKKCGEITKANFPELGRNYLSRVNALCYGTQTLKGNCKYAIDPQQCKEYDVRRVRALQEQQIRDQRVRAGSGEAERRQENNWPEVEAQPTQKAKQILRARYRYHPNRRYWYRYVPVPAKYQVPNRLKLK
jgi:hypothetical protein